MINKEAQRVLEDEGCMNSTEEEMKGRRREGEK